MLFFMHVRARQHNTKCMLWNWNFIKHEKKNKTLHVNILVKNNLLKQNNTKKHSNHFVYNIILFTQDSITASYFMKLMDLKISLQ